MIRLYSRDRFLIPQQVDGPKGFTAGTVVVECVREIPLQQVDFSSTGGFIVFTHILMRCPGQFSGMKTPHSLQECLIIKGLKVNRIDSHIQILMSSNQNSNRSRGLIVR